MSLRQQVVRGGALLTLRQGLGMAVNVGGVLLLTRTIGPAAYGLYAAAVGIYLYLQLIGQWGIHVYLIRREAEPTEAVYHQAFVLLLLSGVVTAAAGLLAAPLLSAWIGIEGIRDVARALFLLLPLHLVGLVPIARLERALNYGTVAIVELLALVAFFAVALPLAFTGLGAWAAVWGWWAQQALLAGLSFVAAGYRPRLTWRRELAADMLHYGVSYSASIWIWQARKLVNPLVVGPLVGASGVGIVALTVQIVQNLTFVSTAVWRVSTAALAKVQAEPARMARAISEGMKLQTLVVGPILVVFGWVAPALIPLLLGREWAPVAEVYPFIALAYLTIGVFNLHSAGLYVLGRNWEISLFHVAHAALLFAGTYLLVPRLGLIGYGWAEVVTLLGYAVVHRLVSRYIGALDYGPTVLYWTGFTVALFPAMLGWWSLLGLLPVLVWPGTWREWSNMISGLRGLAYGK